MFEPNVTRVLDLLRDDDRVLDVGGWYQPFCRADVVVDLLPYATRGLGGRTGVGPERFDASTWVVQDVCSAPLPFPDGAFDYVVCSHILEDVRDPVYLCSELVRVAKRGYLEVPSRVVESVRGLEGRNYVGLYHHRWLVEVQDGGVVFRVKPHAIHEDRRYHLPRRHIRRLSAADRIQWLFWEGGFTCAEAVQVSHVQTRRELAAFVDRTAPLGPLERLAAVLRAPLVGWQYRDWRALQHPLEVRVGRDTSVGEIFWGNLPELLSTTATQRVDGTLRAGGPPRGQQPAEGSSGRDEASPPSAAPR
jgi:hypothetical protein